MRTSTLISLLACFLLLTELTACGKKGPLYLPDDQAEKPVQQASSDALRLQPSH